MAVLGWLAISTVLIFHLRMFYAIEWHNSLKWGVGDGFLWVVLLGFCIWLYRATLNKGLGIGRTVAFGIACLVIAVILHPACTVLLFWFVDGTIAHPFWQQVTFLASKKLPEGILAGLILVYICKLASGTEERLSADQKTGDRLSPESDWMILENNTGMHKIAVERISYLETAGNYVEIYADQGIFIKRTTLKSMENRLKNRWFIRISRKHLVNVQRAVSMHNTGARTAQVELDNGNTLSVSRRHKSAFKNAFRPDFR